MPLDASPDRVALVGEGPYGLLERRRGRRLERARHVVQLDGPHLAEHVGRKDVADALGGGP
jgi:hypothetical protein